MRSVVRAVLSVSLLLATSCGLAGKEFTVKRVVNVHASATDPLCTEGKVTFNLSEDKAFNDLKANIGSVQLRKVRVLIANPKTDASSVATKADGELRVSVADSDAGLLLGTFGGVALTADNAQEVTFDAANAKTVIDAALNPPHTFYVKAKGCADAVPAFFDFAVEMTVYAGLKL